MEQSSEMTNNKSPRQLSSKPRELSSEQVVFAEALGQLFAGVWNSSRDSSNADEQSGSLCCFPKDESQQNAHQWSHNDSTQIKCGVRTDFWFS
ncbi:MAG: hypothetical protein IH991_04280 [Planctomycetes bacterium]|nr:hypothetical protein [Planctomycetota bacterium]